MHCDWDPEKDALNVVNHGLSFEEAEEVFAPGVVALEIADIEHSDEEDRFLTIGPIVRGLVVVVWTEREGDVVRIISAWFADRREREMYRRFLKRGGV